MESKWYVYGSSWLLILFSLVLCMFKNFYTKNIEASNNSSSLLENPKLSHCLIRACLISLCLFLSPHLSLSSCSFYFNQLLEKICKKIFNWSIVDLRCCVSFRCTVKWLSCASICIFSDSCPFQVITKYWI